MRNDHFFWLQGNYRFSYAVEDNYSGNQFGHTENRDGAGTTAGEYHVRLPDGRVQTVEYTVDYRGYHANVFYHGDSVGVTAPTQFVHEPLEPVIYLGHDPGVTSSLQPPVTRPGLCYRSSVRVMVRDKEPSVRPGPRPGGDKVPIVRPAMRLPRDLYDKMPSAPSTPGASRREGGPSVSKLACTSPQPAKRVPKSVASMVRR